MIVKIFFLIFIIALVSIAHYTFLFFSLSLLPTFVSYLLDKRPSKTATSIIGSFNFVGILPQIFSLWQTNNYNVRFREMISDPYVWILVYGASAIGIFIIWLIPEIFGAIYLAKAEKKIKELERQKQDLVAEWGEEVTLASMQQE